MKLILSLVALAFGMAANPCVAAIVVPIGLAPGDSYYLAFVTSGERDALSTDIADYDAFVQAQAALNPSLTGTDEGVLWRALGSTASISAFSHLSLGEYPIYLVDGTTKVADGGSDLWDGTLDNPIGLDQFAASRSVQVYTGTNVSGAAFGPLGSPGPVPPIRFGTSTSATSFWVNFGTVSSGSGNRSYYAFSELLTVPQTDVVPEPTSVTAWALLAAAGASFIIPRVQRRVAA